ncbi:MAG: hypothetical protein GXO47_06715 [Chlorobi bacterium]|nr:hypothetical protein [Chlorobiota bacterium]
MKRILFLSIAVALLFGAQQTTKAQLSDEEYNYVTMDLRGILNLTMTTNPQVDFTFKTIQEYQHGITRFNATQLEVDATLAWDLFVYASTDNWIQVEAYSTNGNPCLPAEILELQSSVQSYAPENINSFTSLKGATNSGVAAGVPSTDTQFLAGAVGTDAAANESFPPGTAAGNPDTHKFRIDMRLVPGIPAEFGNSTIALDSNPNPDANDNGEAYAQAGYYYIEVVYSLVEDL